MTRLVIMAGKALIRAMYKLGGWQLPEGSILTEVQWQLLIWEGGVNARAEESTSGPVGRNLFMYASICRLFVLVQGVLWRLPVAFCCSNVRCKKVGGISELGRVVGRNTAVCQQCRAACYCSKRCQKDAWPFHQQVCKAALRRGTRCGVMGNS